MAAYTRQPTSYRRHVINARPDRVSPAADGDARRDASRNFKTWFHVKLLHAIMIWAGL